MAEAALDLAAKKGHWVILQVWPLFPDGGRSGPHTCLDLTSQSLGFSALSSPLTHLSFHTLAPFTSSSSLFPILLPHYVLFLTPPPITPLLFLLLLPLSLV